MRLARKAVLAGSLLVLYGCISAYADFGTAGWTTMRKVQTTEFRPVASLAPGGNGLAGILYNPALTAAGRQRELFVVSESGLAQDRLGGVFYGQPLKNGMLSGGLVYYDAGTIELNWMENGALMSQNASAQQDMMGMISYGVRRGKKLFLGGSLKMVKSTIAEQTSASAIAADFGALYYPNKKMPLSITLQNAGYSTKFEERANPLPTLIYAGAGYLHQSKKSYVMPGAGISYNLTDQTALPEVGIKAGFDILSLNAGYRFGMSESMWHLGFGITWNSIEIGYSFMPSVYLDPVQRISMSVKFGKRTAQAKKPAVMKKPALKNARTVTPSAARRPR